MESLRGQLLIASPKLHDPNFRRTVVLVAEHGDGGALGLVLNRPSSVGVAEAAPALAPLVAADEPVYVGGPVQPGAVLVLVEAEDPSLVADLIVGDVGLVGENADLDDVATRSRRARVFAGYAGWSAEQLEREVESLDWIVEAATPDDLFAPAATDLWSAVLRRKGREFRLIATMPVDPSLN